MIGYIFTQNTFVNLILLWNINNTQSKESKKDTPTYVRKACSLISVGSKHEFFI